MSSLEGFSRRMDVLGTRIVQNAASLVRKTALEAHRAVAIGTPVDTGRARSNWLVSLGSPATHTVLSSSIQAAFGQAQGAVAGYKQGDIHITNNLPYIGRLNDGYSKQAPANFVEDAVNRATQVVRNHNIVDGKG